MQESYHWVGITSSVPTNLGKFSVSPFGGGAPRATEVMYCEGEGVAGEAHCSCSSAPLRFRPSGSSSLVGGEPQVPYHSGPHLSWVDLRWVHLHWMCSRVVVP